jgi:HEAT repeat protein
MAGELLVRTCTSDPEWRVRRSAGQALAALGLKQHLPVLRALQKRSSNQACNDGHVHESRRMNRSFSPS